MKKNGTIIIAPPWPRSGTGNIIAAQSLAHAKRGERVYLLLEPLGPWHSKLCLPSWAKITKNMKFHGVDQVDYPRAPRWKLSWWLQKILETHNDGITTVAEYAASGTLPQSLSKFVRSHEVGIIRVNHVFGMLLALKVLKLIRKAQRQQPVVILDTHDVQTDMFVSGQRLNLISGTPDDRTILLQGELALASSSDLLIHISKKDCNFFRNKLPEKRHALLLPTLDPIIERKIIKNRKKKTEIACDFVYVGNNHEANLETVKWLLESVLPACGKKIPRIQIIGTIKSLFEHREPLLFKNYRELFVGEVRSILSAYQSAKAVLAPAVMGTGASIKLTEALCVGKPIITTTIGVRAIPRNISIGNGLIIHDNPKKFAAAMLEVAASKKHYSEDNARLYDTFFSSQAYARELDKALKRFASPL